jgi:hypothetical protein
LSRKHHLLCHFFTDQTQHIDSVHTLMDKWLMLSCIPLLTKPMETPQKRKNDDQVQV